MLISKETFDNDPRHFGCHWSLLVKARHAGQHSLVPRTPNNDIAPHAYLAVAKNIHCVEDGRFLGCFQITYCIDTSMASGSVGI